ncbi:hypothetical protein Q6312_28300, partial [Klebsiella pneumoniae]|uniref:hypothetical protein n=1 Tax=Klebsiella pneumoniae TaxID=573 RepID=UPI0027310F82
DEQADNFFTKNTIQAIEKDKSQAGQPQNTIHFTTIRDHNITPINNIHRNLHHIHYNCNTPLNTKNLYNYYYEQIIKNNKQCISQF